MSKCKCKICGKIFEAPNGFYQYCSNECRRKPIFTSEFNGQRFGKLEVINAYRQTNDRGRRAIYAICKCDCGNTCEVRYDCLKSGNNTSCGCKQATTQFKSLNLKGKTNKYGCVALEDIGTNTNRLHIWRCKCHCGKEYIIEAARFYRVMSCGCDKNTEKARAKVNLSYEKGTSVYSILPGKICKNNTSGVRGVHWDSRKGRWRAQIKFQGKLYYLGSYVEKNNAISARKDAEKHLFGDFLQWFKMAYPERWKKLQKRGH